VRSGRASTALFRCSRVGPEDLADGVREPSAQAMGMHLVHSGPVVTHRSPSSAQPEGQQVCANAGDISTYAKTMMASFKYRIAVLPFRLGGRCAVRAKRPPHLWGRKRRGRWRRVLHEGTPPQMVNVDF